MKKQRVKILICLVCIFCGVLVSCSEVLEEKKTEIDSLSALKNTHNNFSDEVELAKMSDAVKDYWQYSKDGDENKVKQQIKKLSAEFISPCQETPSKSQSIEDIKTSSGTEESSSKGHGVYSISYLVVP